MKHLDQLGSLRTKLSLEDKGLEPFSSSISAWVSSGTGRRLDWNCPHLFWLFSGLGPQLRNILGNSFWQVKRIYRFTACPTFFEKPWRSASSFFFCFSSMRVYLSHPCLKLFPTNFRIWGSQGLNMGFIWWCGHVWAWLQKHAKTTKRVCNPKQLQWHQTNPLWPNPVQARF